MKNCPVCDKKDFDFLFQAQNRHGRHLLDIRDSFAMKRCRECGLVFPDVKAIDDAYYARYYQKGYYEEGVVKGFLAWMLEKLGHASFKIKQAVILKFSAPCLTKKLKLLDVGCGAGHFLQALDSQRFDKFGLEVNEEGVASCLKKGLNVCRGGMDFSGLAPDSFDVLTLWHVLEHLENPARGVDGARKLLKKGGVLALSTPDTQSLAFCRGREYWFHLDAPRHLALFNKNNLKKLLERKGFKIKQVRYLPWDFPLDLFWSLRRSLLVFLVCLFYPLVKLFDRQNLFVIAVKV